MLAKLRGPGNDGRTAYEDGAVITTDSDWIRRLLVNGLAEPLDDETRALATFPGMVARHKSQALIDAAQGAGVPTDGIPALNVRV